MNWKKSEICFGLLFSFALVGTVGMNACSRNRARGQSAAVLIKRSLEDAGPVAAREEFTRLLKYKDLYVFDEGEFLSLGNDYLKAKTPFLAEAVFEMSVEAFPGSISGLRLLAHSAYMSGHEENSLKAQAKMMSIRGKSELADFLKKNGDSLASTAEEVIERCLDATGGKAAWATVKTMVVVFSIQSTAGEQPRMVRMYKRPFLYRQGLEGSPNFVATDGTACWRVNGEEWKRESSNSYLPLVSMDRWLLDYEAFGIAYEFMGFDHINGSPVYHLRRTYREGFVEDLFFSILSDLLTEIRSDYVQHQPFMKSFLSLWNYRDVNGVKIPFVFMRNMGSLEPPHGGVVEEVRINVPLDDKLFFPPDHKK
jgi:hypothetical protein